MGGCLTEVQLFQTYRRETSPEELLDALHHVLGCSLCHEHWRRFALDEQVAAGIRSAVEGDIQGADETPGVSEAIRLPDKLGIPGFRLRGDFVEGGQARVYRAVHEASQEEVAIKVFHNSPLNEGGDARFSRELQSLARLRHPHVIPIRSAGEILGHAYFVMPWIEGIPLDQHISKRKPDIRQRLDLLIKICSAVDHAHKRGVMHLDLKPSNVLVDSSGEPMVMDFGLARLSTGETADGEGWGLGVAGTPAYMAPEQASDREDVDTRSDVFMLGLLLYEVLCGRRARHGSAEEAQHASLDLARQEPPPIRQAAPHLGTELAVITQTATAMDREKRYQTAKALLDDLERYRSGEPVRVMGEGFLYRMSKFSRKHLAVLVGVLAVALVVTSAMIVRRESQGMLEEAYGRGVLIDNERFQAEARLSERRRQRIQQAQADMRSLAGELAGVYQELADAYSQLGKLNQTQRCTAHAKEARKRADTTSRPTTSDDEPPAGGDAPPKDQAPTP